jgi:hypothetical protein
MTKMDATLTERLSKVRAQENLEVIVTLARQEDMDAVLRKTGARPRLKYESIPAFAAALSPAKIREIAMLPEVQHVELDSEARAIDKH